MNHHKIFKQLKNPEAGIFWCNAVLLHRTSFIPFPTAVPGDYPDNRASVLFGPVTYLPGALPGFLHPYLSFTIYLGIPVYFIFSETGKTADSNKVEEVTA